MSQQNNNWINENKRKLSTKDLPYAALRKASEVRPKHSNRQLLNNFTQRCETREDTMPTPNKNTSINLYDDIQSRTAKMSSVSLRKSVENLRYANNLVDSRSLETKRESSKVAYKSIFQKEKEEQL